MFRAADTFDTALSVTAAHVHIVVMNICAWYGDFICAEEREICQPYTWYFCFSFIVDRVFSACI